MARIIVRHIDDRREVELTDAELHSKIESGEISLCTAGCNDTGMNDDLPVYHDNRG